MKIGPQSGSFLGTMDNVLISAIRHIVSSFHGTASIGTFCCGNFYDILLKVFGMEFGQGKLWAVS